MSSMRYLGIDYGSKRIGLALSDDAGTMGFPHDILENARAVTDALCALIARERVGAVVIGDSRDFSGAENPIAAAARTLGDELQKRTGVPVAYEPEALTSAQARRAPEKMPKVRTASPRAPVDASAAALILTSYLSRHSHD